MVRIVGLISGMHCTIRLPDHRSVQFSSCQSVSLPVQSSPMLSSLTVADGGGGGVDVGNDDAVFDINHPSDGEAKREREGGPVAALQ